MQDGKAIRVASEFTFNIINRQTRILNICFIDYLKSFFVVFLFGMISLYFLIGIIPVVFYFLSKIHNNNKLNRPNVFVSSLNRRFVCEKIHDQNSIISRL